MELRKRPQDGISWVQKVAAAEIGFRVAPGCFWGIWIYIGGRSRSVELRGAHEGGGVPRGQARLGGFGPPQVPPGPPLCSINTPKIPEP